MHAISVVLTTVSFGFILPTAISLNATKSQWARLVRLSGAVFGLLGIWIAGGNPLTGYRVLNVVLSLLVVIELCADWYLPKYLKPNVSRRRAKLLDAVYKVVQISVLAFGWMQITLGSLGMLGIVHWPETLFGHACAALLLVFLGVFWLLRGTGLCCVDNDHSPEYYDSVFATIMSVILLPHMIISDFLWSSPENGVLDVPVHAFFFFMMLAASLLGIWLSKDQYNRPSRHLLPSLIAVLAGQLMIAHHQDTPLGKAVHEGFGYSLVAIGCSRAAEVLMVPRVSSFPDANTPTSHDHIRYLPPMFAVISAFMILAGDDDIVNAFNDLGIRPPGYLAIIQACAFMYFWFITALIRRVAARTHPLASCDLTSESEYHRLLEETPRVQQSTV